MLVLDPECSIKSSDPVSWVLNSYPKGLNMLHGTLGRPIGLVVLSIFNVIYALPDLRFINNDTSALAGPVTHKCFQPSPDPLAPVLDYDHCTTTIAMFLLSFPPLGPQHHRWTLTHDASAAKEDPSKVFCPHSTPVVSCELTVDYKVFPNDVDIEEDGRFNMWAQDAVDLVQHCKEEGFDGAGGGSATFRQGKIWSEVLFRPIKANDILVA